jgi:hypothetical protein
MFHTNFSLLVKNFVAPQATADADIYIVLSHSDSVWAILEPGCKVHSTHVARSHENHLVI